jgi:phage terminase large subunit-like protein
VTETAVRSRRTRGASGPFSVAHFRRWAEQFELDNGHKFRLEPFQEHFVRDVFRGKSICWLVIPQGNGKTTLVALLSLYHIEFTEFGSVMISAATREQATTIAQVAQGLLIRSGREGEFVCQVEGNRRIRFDQMHSRMQVKAADEKTGDGIIPTLCIIDELHRQKSLGLYRTWRGKLKKRGAQMIVISTAGEPGGEFEEQRDRYRQMAAEVEREQCFTRSVGETFVMHDWSLPQDGDSDDLELVVAANPLKAVSIETLREERESPDWNHQHWRRLTCNLPTRSEHAAITEDEWFGAQVEEDIPAGERIWFGIDLGWKYDTTGLQPLWTPSHDYRLLGKGVTIVPPRNGQTTHPDTIKAAILEIHKRTPIHTVVMDISNGEDIAAWCEDELGCPVVDRGQGNQYACVDYEKFMEALRSGWLKHTEDPSLTQHVLNAIARAATYGDLRFDRPSSSRTDKWEQDRRVIDRLSAAAMAHTSAASELDFADVPLAAMA